MSSFYVSHNGEQMGPWSILEIMGKIKNNELAMVDYLYDETKQDWVLFMDVPELQNRPAPQKPVPMKPAPQPVPVVNREWYILKGENKFGPFAYTDVIRMLQQKAVFEFDFAWHPGLDAWKRVAECTEFAAESIRTLKDNQSGEVEEVFFRRRHQRVGYGGTILVHDNKTVWKGQGVEISAGGAGVVMENAMVVPGQILYLHFKPGDGVPPFNAICEVVNKRFSSTVQERNAPIEYGLKFINVSQATQKFLTDFAGKKAMAA